MYYSFVFVNCCSDSLAWLILCVAILLDLAYFSGCFVCTLKQQARSYEHMQLKLEKFKVDD